MAPWVNRRRPPSYWGGYCCWVEIFHEKEDDKQALLVKLIDESKQEIKAEREKSDLQRQKSDEKIDLLAREFSVTIKEISATYAANLDKVVSAFREARELDEKQESKTKPRSAR